MIDIEKPQIFWIKNNFAILRVYFIVIILAFLFYYFNNIFLLFEFIAIVALISIFFSIVIIVGIVDSRFDTVRVKIDDNGLYVKGFYFDKPRVDEYILPNDYRIILSVGYRTPDLGLIIVNRKSGKTLFIIRNLHIYKEQNNLMVLKIHEYLKANFPEYLRGGYG